MKKSKKYNVFIGKKAQHFSERADAVKFIAENHQSVTEIKQYGVLSSGAIRLYKEALRSIKTSN